MLLILGLGNPGIKFENTRHNVGFLIIDKIKKTFNFPEFEFNKKFNAQISKETNTLLAKPQTFMNLSGTSTKSILDFFKLTPKDLVVIHDDIDIPLGKYKIAIDSRSAGHNGVQNIIDNLGTQKFYRIRVGVGNSKNEKLEEESTCRIGAHDFVLEKFSKKEITLIEEISENILQEIEKLLKNKKIEG